MAAGEGRIDLPRQGSFATATLIPLHGDGRRVRRLGAWGRRCSLRPRWVGASPSWFTFNPACWLRTSRQRVGAIWWSSRSLDWLRAIAQLYRRAHRRRRLFSGPSFSRTSNRWTRRRKTSSWRRSGSGSAFPRMRTTTWWSPGPPGRAGSSALDRPEIGARRRRGRAGGRPDHRPDADVRLVSLPGDHGPRRQRAPQGRTCITPSASSARPGSCKWRSGRCRPKRNSQKAPTALVRLGANPVFDCQIDVRAKRILGTRPLLVVVRNQVAAAGPFASRAARPGRADRDHQPPSG